VEAGITIRQTEKTPLSDYHQEHAHRQKEVRSVTTSSSPIEPAPRFEVTSLGETLLRLSVPAGTPLAGAARFEVYVGGTESNVCAALAGLGRRSGWLGALPDNPLGRLVLRQLRAAGVDASAVVMTTGARLGLCFTEVAAPPRTIQVVYDRSDSAAARLTVADVAWDYLLDTRALHLTGITPSLSGSCRELIKEAVSRAREAGVAVSFDVNYRRRLWSPGEAAAALRPLIAEVDLLICADRDARTLFGCQGEVGEVLEQLAESTEARWIVLTLGSDGVAALADGQHHHQPAPATSIIDPIGAGDALAAGVIDGWLEGSITEGLRRGSALAALALTQAGDMVVIDRRELEEVLAGSNGRVLR